MFYRGKDDHDFEKCHHVDPPLTSRYWVRSIPKQFRVEPGSIPAGRLWRAERHGPRRLPRSLLFYFCELIPSVICWYFCWHRQQLATKTISNSIGYGIRRLPARAPMALPQPRRERRNVNLRFHFETAKNFATAKDALNVDPIKVAGAWRPCSAILHQSVCHVGRQTARPACAHWWPRRQPRAQLARAPLTSSRTR
jgi:hypothetical protein